MTSEEVDAFQNMKELPKTSENAQIVQVISGKLGELTENLGTFWKVKGIISSGYFTKVQGIFEKFGELWRSFENFKQN